MSKGGHGSYFRQMVSEAIRQARLNLPASQKRAAREVRKNQDVVNIRLRSTDKVPAMTS
jgi:hypothetical protein